jgi:hypothetical protein
MDFEAYAEAQYLPAIKDPEADELTLLAGLRFVETRAIGGYESRLREIFTTRRKGEIGREIDDACLHALLATSEDMVSTAAFLALAATMREPLSTSRLAEISLHELGPVGTDAVLRELGKPRHGKRLRRLARMLVRMTHVQPPEPMDFWEKADDTRRREAADRWRAKIRKERPTRRD